MEGVNMGGILLGYLAVFVFGGAFLAALGLLLARWVRASRFVFAGGFLLATLVMSVAVLSFLERELGNDASVAMIVAATAILLLAGIGQFIAAFRSSPWIYVAALTCSLTALTFGTIGTMTGLVRFGAMTAVVSGLLAAASFVIAVLPRFGGRQETTDDTAP